MESVDQYEDWSPASVFGDTEENERVEEEEARALAPVSKKRAKARVSELEVLPSRIPRDIQTASPNQERQQLEIDIDLHEAALLIQRTMRVNLYRKQEQQAQVHFAETLAKLKQLAALQIQAAFRKYLFRQRALLHAKQFVGSRRIQQMYRRWKATQIVRKLLAERKLIVFSATKIQAIWKLFLHRKRRQHSALQIQCIYRVYKAQLALRELQQQALNRERAMRMIQSVWQQRKADQKARTERQRLYHKKCKAAICIQRSWTRKQARRAYQKSTVAATLLQVVWRKHKRRELSRRKCQIEIALRDVASRRIQARWKEWAAEKRAQRQALACGKITQTYQKYRMRIYNQQRRQAKTRIGRVISSFVSRKRYTERKLYTTQLLQQSRQHLLFAQQQQLLANCLYDWAEFARQSRLTREDVACFTIQQCYRMYIVEKQAKQRTSAATILQKHIRGFQARVQVAHLHEKRLSERQFNAHVLLQSVARGFLDRAYAKRLRRRLAERFRCTNCGLIEPGGVYCKGCGRRRRKTSESAADFNLAPVRPSAPRRAISMKINARVNPNERYEYLTPRVVNQTKDRVLAIEQQEKRKEAAVEMKGLDLLRRKLKKRQTLGKLQLANATTN